MRGITSIGKIQTEMLAKKVKDEVSMLEQKRKHYGLMIHVSIKKGRNFGVRSVRRDSRASPLSNGCQLGDPRRG